MDLLDYPAHVWPILATDPNTPVGVDWLRWFQRVHSVITQLGTASGLSAPALLAPATTPGARLGDLLTFADLHTSLPTSRFLAPLRSGPVRIHWYLEETAADGQGGSLQVQVGWTHLGRPLTRVFEPLEEDTIYANASATIPVLVDANSPITYAVAYHSAMRTLAYTFSVWVTQP